MSGEIFFAPKTDGCYVGDDKPISLNPNEAVVDTTVTRYCAENGACCVRVIEIDPTTNTCKVRCTTDCIFHS